MLNLFEVKVKYTGIDESTGKEKKLTDCYLIDAVSFTDAEAIITSEMEAIITGEFEVHSIKRESVADCVFNENGKWYKSKVSYTDLDETTGKEKKSKFVYMVKADSVDHAKQVIDDLLKEMVVPYEVKSISETNIVDILLY